MAGALPLHFHRKRKQRANMDQFDGDVENPVDLGSVAASGSSNPYTMPANARLTMSHSVALAAEDVTVNVGANRSFSHPALNADEVFRGRWAEENQDIVIDRGNAPAGTFSLGVLDPFGRVRVVATATFT